MNDTAESTIILNELCSGQQLAVLASTAGTEPYANLVAFASSPDLRHLFFSTPRATRKWANITSNPRVALLIDNRRNQFEDFDRASAATIVGMAEELNDSEREEGLAIYLAKHPHLAEFASAPSCALFRVRVATIYLVTHFQRVMEYHFTS